MRKLRLMGVFIAGFCVPLVFFACSHKPQKLLIADPADQFKEYKEFPKEGIESIVDATPQPEPKSRYGNHSPYEVFGQRYHVMDSSEGYQEQGLASWYGPKFHGRRTSSWEPYNMFEMTAAHKSLPLPTYVKVRNLDNNREIVVKVNDRGPFKDGRIIDLSYAAAYKLGAVEKGIVPVEVIAIPAHQAQASR